MIETVATPYDSRFYDVTAAWSQESAEVIVPQLLKMVPVESVVDVGCGVGTWAATFLKKGVRDVVGVDGSYVERNALQIPFDYFLPADLERGLSIPRKFDLAVCVEVAEHLSPSRSQSFVEDLANLAPLILFSAAVPSQGGTNHKNERWQSYWEAAFLRCGYHTVDCLRPKIWKDDRVKWWYRQNLLLFCRADECAKYEPLSGKGPLDLIHPRHLEDKLHFPKLSYLIRSFPGALSRSVRYHLGRLSNPR